MDLQSLIDKRDSLRMQWQNIREERLKAKAFLLSQGMDVKDMRKDREYKAVRKNQMHLSKRIKHLDAEINRKRSRTCGQ